jgi:hypothetical protein
MKRMGLTAKSAPAFLLAWTAAVFTASASNPARAASDDAACAAWSAHRDDAAAWIDVGERLAAGKRLACFGAVQERLLGRASRASGPADPWLVGAVAREALALTWAPDLRSRALRLAVDAAKPHLVPCQPKQDGDCPSAQGEPETWWTFRALFVAETGALPDNAASLTKIREAASRFSGWVEPGTESTETCSAAPGKRPRVDAPPTDPRVTCGEHGYRVCPVAPNATWVHVAKTYCESDALEKAAYGDENGDGIEDATLWIRYGLISDDEVVGNLRYVDVVDGRRGRILLHGVVAATLFGSDGGSFALTVQRIGPGRLRLELPTKTDHAAEVRLRRQYPEFLAPGTYVLEPNGYHRTSGK